MKVYKYEVEDENMLVDCRLVIISRSGHKPISIDSNRKERAYRSDKEIYTPFLLTTASTYLKEHYDRHNVRSIFAGVSDDENIKIESNINDLILT